MSNKIQVTLEKLHEDAKIPVYKTKGSAGFDFYTVESKVAKAHKTTLFRTGLAMEIPDGYELQIRDRSGMCIKTTLRVANAPGTIDSDYRGEIKVIMDNIGDEDCFIEKGTRIAQGVLNKISQADFTQGKLSDTERGEGGFGSTGTK